MKTNLQKLKAEIIAFLVWFIALFPMPKEGFTSYVNRFVNDTSGDAGKEYTAPVMMVISGIIWVICVPIYVDAVQDANTTGWTFTGSTGAITLFLLMPFIFIAGGVVWILKKALA